jgi:hypothetical protein
MDSSNDNESLLCMHGAQFSLQSRWTVEAVNTVYFMVRRADMKLEHKGTG